MFELLGAGSLLVVGVVLFALLWAASAVFFTLIVLPFKLLGFLLRGLAVLLALPFILVIGLLGVVLFGAGLLAFLVPVLPLVALIAIGAWFFRRRRPRATSAAS